MKFGSIYIDELMAEFGVTRHIIAVWIREKYLPPADITGCRRGTERPFWKRSTIQKFKNSQVYKDNCKPDKKMVQSDL